MSDQPIVDAHLAQKVADLTAQVTALEQDKADSQDANTKLRTELDELRIDMRSEQRMSEDLEQQLAACEVRVKALEKALTYCAAGPGELHPLNQAQYLVARAALSKEAV